ncbi:hypothetical protein PT974_03755 [Cladobotryum mycophilum]|uniref:Uncharacterized protein n=1 Tax=Cladobotryum mycophilum TaxID=491253 RepID=A0ABR0ST67_9HYPO
MGILSNNPKRRKFPTRTIRVPVPKSTANQDNHDEDQTLLVPSHASTIADTIKPVASTENPMISTECWETWLPILGHVKDSLRINLGTKSEFETILGEGYLKVTFYFLSDETSPTIELLSVIHVCGKDAKIATRTIIEHNERSGCGLWGPFSLPERKILPCCDELHQDVPETGELSRYEHDLQLSKRDSTIRALEATAHRQVQDKSLKEQVKFLRRANTRIAKHSLVTTRDKHELKNQIQDLKDQLVSIREDFRWKLREQRQDIRRLKALLKGAKAD